MATDLPSDPPRDLSALSRGDRARPAPAAASIPPPPIKWKTRVWLPLGLLFAALLLFSHTITNALMPAQAVRVVPVVMKAGVETESGVSVQAPGWVEAAPYPISVPALADGTVSEVLVLEGQTVKAGNVVARMVDDDAKLALSRAESELAQKQATLRAAQSTWDNPTERTRAVAAAEGAVAETKAQIAQLAAEVAAETARAEELRDRLRRNERAREQQAATDIEVVQTKLQLAAQEGVLRAREAQRPVLEAQLRQREAELWAARENLRLRIDERKALDEATATVADATAKRDEAKLRLSRMEVRSPADGIVMERMVEPGSKLSFAMDPEHSAHAVRLYDPSKLQVRVDIPLGDAAKVGVGQKARIVVGVLPDRTFDGEVTGVVSQADIQKNTLQVKVAISNPSHELKPEMLARVRFLSSTNSSATTQPSQQVFAPENLLKKDGDGAIAWVVVHGLAEQRSVAVGTQRQDGWVSVRSGLQAGDQLIAGDHSALRSGSKLKVIGESTKEAHQTFRESKGGQHVTH